MSYREYIVRVGKEPDDMQKGLKSSYARALSVQNPVPCGTIRYDQRKDYYENYYWSYNTPVKVERAGRCNGEHVPVL